MQLVRLTVGGGDRSVPLARCKQGVVAHGRQQVIKADGQGYVHIDERTVRVKEVYGCNFFLSVKS